MIQFRRDAMEHPKYKLRITKSRLDYQLYNVLFPRYDPSLVQDIFIHVAPPQIITPQTKIATYTLRTLNNHSQHSPTAQQLSLFVNHTGIVETISDDFELISYHDKQTYRLGEGAKKGNLEVLSLRECDHCPREQTFLSSGFSGQYTKGQTRSGTLNICNICQSVLWKYYDPQEIQLSLQSLCNINSIMNVSSMLDHFSWSIIKNEQFTKTTQIGKLDDQEVTIPYLAKATFLIDFDQYRNKIDQNTVVIKIRKVICKHQKIIDGRCQFCFEEVKVDYSLNKRYFYQKEALRGNMHMSENALKQDQGKFIQNLLTNKKVILILDLDNTILHSNQMSELELSTINRLKQFYIIPKIQPSSQLVGKKDLIVVKMRPYFKQFIFVMAKYFQIFVYTKGTKPYAEQICKYIRAQYAGQQRAHPYLTWKPERLLFLKNQKAFMSNIISREQDSREKKSLDLILPHKTEYHLILDDRRDVWDNSSSWVFTREYYYFHRRDRKLEQFVTLEQDISQYLTSEDVDMPEMRRQLIEQLKIIKTHYPQKQSFFVQTNEREDYFLLFAAYALRRVHKNFFEALRTQKAEKQYLQKNKQEMNQKNSHQKEKTSKINLSYQYFKTKCFMKNIKIRYFLGEGQSQNNNNTIRRAKTMRSIEVTDDNPRLVIRANDLMKQKKKPTLSPNPPESQMTQENTAYYYQQKKKLEELFINKIPIVSQSWIHFCYQFNYPFRFQPFVLKDPFQQQVAHQDFVGIIQSQAKLILKNIEDEMQKEIHLTNNPHLRNKKFKHNNRQKMQEQK